MRQSRTRILRVAVEVMGNFGPRVVKSFVQNLECFGLERRSLD